jgi:hypothetical protein
MTDDHALDLRRRLSLARLLLALYAPPSRERTEALAALEDALLLATLPATATDADG